MCIEGFENLLNSFSFFSLSLLLSLTHSVAIFFFFNSLTRFFIPFVFCKQWEKTHFNCLHWDCFGTPQYLLQIFSFQYEFSIEKHKTLRYEMEEEEINKKKKKNNATKTIIFNC